MNTQPKHAPRVSRSIMRRSMRLLEMEYKPSELADEIQVTTHTIYNVYLPAGLPHRREENGNIWIVGTQFVAWANAALEKGKRYASQRRQPIGDAQCYCVKCREVTDFKHITRKVPLSRKRVMVYGICAQCNGNVSTIKSAGGANGQS